jgi:hypothetical protein
MLCNIKHWNGMYPSVITLCTVAWIDFSFNHRTLHLSFYLRKELYATKNKAAVDPESTVVVMEPLSFHRH